MKKIESNFIKCLSPIQPSFCINLPWTSFEDDRLSDVHAHTPNQDVSEATAPVKPTRARAAPEWYGEWVRYPNLVKEADPKT